MSASPAPAHPSGDPTHAQLTHRLACWVLTAFIFTFVIARILVIFIMAGKLPPALFFHVKGTHVHHLNYGIFLLSIAGADLLFSRPTGKRLASMAVIYGIGLGLTFDEFGMWLHLGGLYWQRASYDAVVIVAAILGLIAFGPELRHWRPRHTLTLVAIALLLVVFGAVVMRYVKDADRVYGPMLYRLETHGPS